MYGMWELDYKESWASKNWCFWIVVLEKILENPLDCKEIQTVHPKGDQFWIFFGRTDAEIELQSFGHLMWRTDSLEKTLMLGKIEGRNRRGWQRMRWLDGCDSMHVSLSNLWEWWWMGKPAVLQSMGSQRVRHNWTSELNWKSFRMENSTRLVVPFCWTLWPDLPQQKIPASESLQQPSLPLPTLSLKIFYWKRSRSSNFFWGGAVINNLFPYTYKYFPYSFLENLMDRGT